MISDIRIILDFPKMLYLICLETLKSLEIFPIRGRISTPLNILFQPRWKRHIEKTGINILLDKFVSDTKNFEQCSGFNFIVNNNQFNVFIKFGFKVMKENIFYWSPCLNPGRNS